MQYALEGSIAVAGAGISWLKDKLQLFETADECETLAASVPHTAGKPLAFCRLIQHALLPHFADWLPPMCCLCLRLMGA